jgi:hypothetical protein
MPSETILLVCRTLEHEEYICLTYECAAQALLRGRSNTEGPGHTAYTDQPGTSRQHHPWAPSPSHHSTGSSQADSEEGHRRSRSCDSQPRRSVDRSKPSRRHQEPPRHSVLGVEGQLAHLNLRMDTISEEQVNINQRLADQQQWNA